MNKTILLLSCEHATNFIPDAYSALFKPFTERLNTHQGVDFGALEAAQYMQQVFSCVLIQASTSRLLIDYNRSLHGHCFSSISESLSPVEKEEVIATYYLPYRQKIIQQIDDIIAAGDRVLHCSIHSFTPIFNNQIRNAELSFLYDPKRALEKEYARLWKEHIQKETNQYRIRMNYPYKGISDGVTTAMRARYAAADYSGLEIEINQSLVLNKPELTIKKDLAMALQQILSSSENKNGE